VLHRPGGSKETGACWGVTTGAVVRPPRRWPAQRPPHRIRNGGLWSHQPGHGSRVRNIRPVEAATAAGGVRPQLHGTARSTSVSTTLLVRRLPEKKTLHSLAHSRLHSSLQYRSSSSAVPLPRAATSAALTTEPLGSASAAAAAVSDPPATSAAQSCVWCAALVVSGSVQRE
jgi:hypothetical protein